MLRQGAHAISTRLTEGLEQGEALPATRARSRRSTVTRTRSHRDASFGGRRVAAATHGRELAVRALLAAGCLQQRVAELLHTSRRSVGRMVEADVTAALRDADVVAQAGGISSRAPAAAS